MTKKEIYDSIKNNLAELRKFFAEMPKGGDLHNHLTGSAYAETYFEVACKNNMYADLETGKLYKNDAKPTVDVVQLSKNMDDLHNVRMTLIDKWSIRNFQPYKCALGPDEYFFGEFGLFSAATDKEELVRYAHELKVRAIEENVLYLEIMGTSPSIPANAFLAQQEYEKYSNQVKDACKEYNKAEDPDKKLKSVFGQICARYEDEYRDSASALHIAVMDYISYIKDIDDNSWDTYVSPFDTCIADKNALTVRYQGYASRTKEPLDVFAQLYIVHKAMQKSSLIVGCNIVAAENSENSMMYYKAHMNMFAVLREKLNSSDIHTSLHAGELTIGLIRPEHLTYHIHDAVNMAKANRIGHGVDIPFEHNSNSILSSMKENNIAIEINLTSNEFILGEKGNSHPFMIYKNAGIPIVICTDDPGILRTSLTEEFALAAFRYDLSYEDIKEINKNAIEYSFLPADEKDKLLDLLQNRMNDFEKEDNNIPEEITIKGRILIAGNDIKESGDIIESGKDHSGNMSVFECLPNNVIVARKHTGDENGVTKYKYGVPFVYFEGNDAELASRHELHPIITVSNTYEKDYAKESDHCCQCGYSEAFTSRKHYGDENGTTIYGISLIGITNCEGFTYTISESTQNYKTKKESDNDAYWMFQDGSYAPMTGREHHGDENGDTKTTFTLYEVTFKKKL